MKRRTNRWTTYRPAIRERMPDLTIVIIEHGMSVIERITNRCVVDRVVNVLQHCSVYRPIDAGHKMRGSNECRPCSK